MRRDYERLIKFIVPCSKIKRVPTKLLYSLVERGVIYDSQNKLNYGERKKIEMICNEKWLC